MANYLRIGKDWTTNSEAYTLELIEHLSRYDIRISVVTNGGVAILDTNKGYYFLGDNGGEVNVSRVNDLGTLPVSLPYAINHTSEMIVTPYDLAVMINETIRTGSYSRGPKGFVSESVSYEIAYKERVNGLHKFRPID